MGVLDEERMKLDFVLGLKVIPCRCLARRACRVV